MKKIDLLEAVSIIDIKDLQKEMEQFGYEAVEHEVYRALKTLNDLRIDLVNGYYDMLKNKKVL